jgi:hypothetical protein
MFVGDGLQPSCLVEGAVRTPHRGYVYRLRYSLRLDVIHELFH